MSSPVHKFPNIVKSLYESGKKDPILEDLRKEIIMQTGIYKDGSLAGCVKLMETLGFIKQTTSGFKIISLDGRSPIKEVESGIKVDENRINEIIEELVGGDISEEEKKTIKDVLCGGVNERKNRKS
jgi:hypothetical protein